MTFISCARSPSSVKVTKTADDIRKELKENTSDSSIEENPTEVSEVSQEQAKLSDAKGVPGVSSVVPAPSDTPAVVDTTPLDTPAVDTTPLVGTAAADPEGTPVVEAAENSKAFDPSLPPDLFDFCRFPDSLQAAVFQQIEIPDPTAAPTAKIDCAVITPVHLAGIKKLDIKNIVSGEKVLLDKEKEIYSSDPEELDEKYGMYFSALEELDMSDNPRMLSIPDFVFHILNLKKLDISMTGVHDFDKSLCPGRNLVVLLSKYNSYNGQHTPMTVLCESESDLEDDTTELKKNPG